MEEQSEDRETQQQSNVTDDKTNFEEQKDQILSTTELPQALSRGPDLLEETSNLTLESGRDASTFCRKSQKNVLPDHGEESSLDHLERQGPNGSKDNNDLLNHSAPGVVLSSLMPAEQKPAQNTGGEILFKEGDHNGVPPRFEDVKNPSSFEDCGGTGSVDVAVAYAYGSRCGGGQIEVVDAVGVKDSASPGKPVEAVITSDSLAAAAKADVLSIVNVNSSDAQVISGKTNAFCLVTPDSTSSAVSVSTIISPNNSTPASIGSGNKIEATSILTHVAADNTMSSSASAMCKYRWAKVVSTDSSDIGFYPSYAPTEPILLTWDAAFKAYLSPEMRIDCGNYHGVLTVDGKPLAVEDFVVKSYTFEVDLFIKEDILEAKCPSPPTLEFSSSPSNPSLATPLPTTSASDHYAADGQDTVASVLSTMPPDPPRVEDVDIPRSHAVSKDEAGLKPALKISADADLSSTFTSRTAELLEQGKNHWGSPTTSADSPLLRDGAPPASAQSHLARRASPIGDDKSGDSALAPNSSDYITDVARCRGERPYADRGGELSEDRNAGVVNKTSSGMPRDLPSKLIDDILNSTVSSRTMSDGDGLPAVGSSRINTNPRADEPSYGISGSKSQDTRESDQRYGEGEDPKLMERPRSTSAFSPSGESRVSPHPTRHESESQSFSQRFSDGIYGRPPSRPTSDHKEEKPTHASPHDTLSDGRYQDYDRHSPASTSSRDRNRDVERGYNFSSRDRLPPAASDREDYNRGGSRLPGVPSFRESNQNKDGRQDGYSDRGSRGSREGSYAGSHHSSRAGSHTSLNSEQELGQYLENAHRNSSEARRERMQPPSSYHDEDSTGILRNARVDRPASMPAYGTHSEPGGGDKRSSTPDNRVRVPPGPSWARSEGSRGGSRTELRASFAQDRMGDTMGGRSSVASSDGRRTVTPGLSNREGEPGGEVEDLRISVDNLRQLVDKRDLEIRRLREELQTTQHGRLSQPRESRSSDRLQESLEYKQLQSEKEILTNEVVALREEVQRLSNRHHSSGRGGEGGSRPNSAISDYSPYSPMVLQRKIADLESQIHDLQEVNETTTSSLSRTEEKVKLLQEENHDLRTRGGSHLEDSGDQHSLRVQMRTLREDVASLKERNFQLTEENMRLQEGQGSRSATAVGMTLQRSGSSLGLKTDENHIQSSSTPYVSSSSASYAPRHTTSSSKGASSSPHMAVYSSRISREDLAPKDYRSRGTSLGRAYDSDHQSSAATDTAVSRLIHHQRNGLDSPRMRYSSTGNDVISRKPPSPSSATSRSGVSAAAASASLSVADRDRSKPDGEVSEHVHSDRYRPANMSSSSYSSFQPESGGRSSLQEKHAYKGSSSSNTNATSGSSSYSARKDRTSGSARDLHSSCRREDPYLAYLSDSKLDRQHTDSHLRRSSTGNPLGSKDIFMNLKKKLASQWQQQDNRYISGNLEFDRYQAASSRDRAEDDGEDSDTATDILLAQDTDLTQGPYRGGKSPGSDGTGASSSDEATEDVTSGRLRETSTSLRRRCRSADPGAGAARHSSESQSWRNQVVTGYSAPSRHTAGPSTASSAPRSTSRGSPAPPYRGPAPSSSTSASAFSAATEDRESMRSVSTAGHRSVLPTPLVTQHNKHEMVKNGPSLLNSSLTQGLRPFAPRSPADIRVDDVVKFSRLGGKLTQGSVKFVGHLPGRSEVYLGVELDKDEGKHDGTFENIRYFKCKGNKGVFVAFNKVVMAWAP